MMKFPASMDKYRMREGEHASSPGDRFGVYIFPCLGQTLRAIACEAAPDLGVDWEHVSVSLSSRCPTWEEMCAVKDIFWEPEDTVMQLHPPRSQYINCHPHVLHLWRPASEKIPMPPRFAV